MLRVPDAGPARTRPHAPGPASGTLLGYDVSILKTSGRGEARCVGVSPRREVSMVRKREPQQGRGGRSVLAA